MSLIPDSFKTKFKKTLSRLQIEKNKKENPISQRKWLMYKLTNLIKNEKMLNQRHIDFDYFRECTSMRKTMQIFDETQRNKKQIANKLSKENKLFHENYYKENNSRNNTTSNNPISKISKTISNFRINHKSDLFCKNPLLLNSKKEYNDYYHSLYPKNNYNMEENEGSLKYSYRLLNVLNEDSVYEKMMSKLNGKKEKKRRKSISKDSEQLKSDNNLKNIKANTIENDIKGSRTKNLILLNRDKNNLNRSKTRKELNIASKISNKTKRDNTLHFRKKSTDYKEEAENIFDELIKNETSTSQREDLNKFKKRKSTKFYFDICNANKYVKLENIYNDLVKTKNKINLYNTQKKPKLKLLYYLYSKNRKNPFDKQEVKDDKIKQMDLNLLLSIHNFK